MGDAERWWAVAVGTVGLVAWAAGSLLSAVPRVDRAVEDVRLAVARRRTPILAGSVLAVGGAALLLWPVAVVASSDAGDVWTSLALLSVASWVLGFALLTVATLVVAAVAWRDPTALEPSTARVLLDASHLATWSVSAPIAAVSVVATTVVAVQADLVGPPVVAAAIAKVATIAVEVAGTGRRQGWNAGGWAAGASGYVTVAWFALLLASLR